MPLGACRYIRLNKVNVYCFAYSHGESYEIKTTTMADTIEKTADSGKTFLIFPLVLVRMAWGLKQIPPEN